MSGMVEKLAAEGLLDDAAVARIKKTVAEFEKFAEEDPETFRLELEKAADFREMAMAGLKRLGGASLTVAGTALGMGAASTLAGKFQAVTDAREHSKSYKTMLDDNPDLRRMDAKLVQRNFKTLSTFNPEYANDPQVAGAYVRQQSSAEGMNWPLLQNVMQAGQKSRPSPEHTGLAGVASRPDIIYKALSSRGPFEEAPQRTGRS